MGKGMRAGKRPKAPGMGGGNMQQQMKQMQAMQRKMDAVQAEIEEMEASATSGGGAVTAVINGKKEIMSLDIKPEIVDPDDVETLTDLLVAGVNEAIKRVDDTNNAELNKITGPMNLPGLF